jgi:hypothetical protein
MFMASGLAGCARAPEKTPFLNFLTTSFAGKMIRAEPE